jgi:hypothetical protein
MKITVDVNGKPVEIELTKDQVALVKKKTEKITDRIKTFQDVLDYIGKKRTQEFEKSCENCSAHNIADKQVELICEVLNEGWIAEPFNTSQYKYYPYFEIKGSAFVFGSCHYWNLNADVGSRLCYKNAELATYAGKQFIDIYTKLLS